MLPAMTSDPTTAAFAMRALQPLAEPGAPPLLRAAALRLAVEGWWETGRCDRSELVVGRGGAFPWRLPGVLGMSPLKRRAPQ